MSKRSLFRILLVICPLLGLNISNAQSPGDTIRVQAFNFDSGSRDSLISFPADDNLTFEKILLKYTMKCKDGLVSTSANVNQGCGQWDFSCNTYLADSSNAESLLSTVPNHFITNFEGSVFTYSETPVYDYLRGTQSSVEIINTNSESSATIGSGTNALNRTLSTDNTASKSHYLYTSDELIAGGISAGEIHGLSLNVLGNANEARFLKIKMKNSSKSELNGDIDFGDFTEVYYNNHIFSPNAENRFQFKVPFMWDGSSNVLVEFNFTNIDTPAGVTEIEGQSTTANMGLSSTDEQEIILTNNAYVECDTYTGIGGSQNRTVEAWIKTTDGSNGEIMAWGTIITGSKWVFRLTDGLLRLEVHGGGTVGSTRVDDGEWHHVACVLSGNSIANIQFYVDGVLDANSTTGSTAVNSNIASSKVRISRGLSNRYLNATVDDVRIWDTNLTEEIINQWKSLKIDDSHPNYSNLQLNYQFDGDGNTVLDSSPNGRHGTLIGDRFSVSEMSGSSLFKDFTSDQNRPNIIFFQGDYETNVTEAVVDRPIAKKTPHLVISRSIEQTDPNFAQDDNILIEGPIEFWTPEEVIYDEATGDQIGVNTLAPDGEFNISDLEYNRRFPYYYELLSFVTPYGIGLDFGDEGASWTFDLSDYAPIFNGDKRILMTLGGQRQEDMDLEFLFIVGTPPRDVVQFQQIWQGTNRIGIANINDIRSDAKFEPLDVNLDPNANSVKLRSSITGHGVEGEFQQNGGIVNHIISLDQAETFIWNINKECSFNPIFPQGGTWVTDRQGWCPGERSIVTEHDLTPYATPGEAISIDYNTTPAPNAAGDYRYHVAHQLVAYGEANFQTDAAVSSVIAPNNSAEFTRVGTVCANPTVVIQNTGAETLTNLTIKYWINDSQAPQTYEWTGNLEFMELEEVVIPSTAELWFDILSENNKFHVEISEPNGSTDEYPHNNTFITNFDFPQVVPSKFSIEVNTNNIPSENSYQLLDSDGNVVGANDLPGVNTIYTDDYDLADGCYKLIVTDSGGDGLTWWANAGQGSGFVRLIDENGATVRLMESDFGGGYEFSFSTTFPVSVQNLDFLTSIEVFPNPTSNFVNVSADDLSDANVYLINALGQKVTSSIVSRNSNLIQLDVSNLGTGLFYIAIQKGDVLTTRKLILN